MLHPAIQPAPVGSLGVLRLPRAIEPEGKFIYDPVLGHRRPGVDLLKPPSMWRHHTLAWLRDNVNKGIPQAYYNLVLGHDLHLSTYATLSARHFHYGQVDPFTRQMEPFVFDGEARFGWMENLGVVSRHKVTTAFRDFITAQLVTETSEYGDFKFHRVGTAATAEANTQTGLTTDAGLNATGTQVNVGSGVYRSVATVTADATETWQEHGLFSQTAGAGTLMDRSLISPTVSVVNLDTVQFTYEITSAAEA